MKKNILGCLLALSLPVLAGSAFADCIKGDCTDGVGVKENRDGSTYDGHFRGGLYNGQGTRSYPNGTKYVGTWENNKQHGKGTFTYLDGSTYDPFNDRFLFTVKMPLQPPAGPSPC